MQWITYLYNRQTTFNVLWAILILYFSFHCILHTPMPPDVQF